MNLDLSSGEMDVTLSFGIVDSFKYLSARVGPFRWAVVACWVFNPCARSERSSSMEGFCSSSISLGGEEGGDGEGEFLEVILDRMREKGQTKKTIW